MKKYMVMVVAHNPNTLYHMLKALDWSQTEFDLFSICMDPLGILSYVQKIKPHIIMVQPWKSIFNITSFIEMCLAIQPSIQIILLDEDGLLPEEKMGKFILLNKITRYTLIDALRAASAQIAQQQSAEDDEHGLIALPQYYGANPLVLTVIQYIQEHYQENIDLGNIAAQAAVSPSHLSRVFKQELGCPVMRYLTCLRLCKAQQLLLNTNAKSVQIAKLVGYADYKYFSRLFSKECGCSPQQYRAGIEDKKEMEL